MDGLFDALACCLVGSLGVWHGAVGALSALGATDWFAE